MFIPIFISSKGNCLPSFLQLTVCYFLWHSHTGLQDIAVTGDLKSELMVILFFVALLLNLQRKN